MENRAYAIVAVVFLIALAGGASALYLWLHRAMPTPRRYVIVSDYSVSGLQPEADVTFKGVRVGIVKEIRFNPGNPKQVLIRIGVYPDAYISHATYAELGYRGITGLSYISLALSADKPDTPLPTTTDRPARIPMRRNLVQALAESGSADIEHANEILKGVGELVAVDNRRRIADVLTSVNQASRDLASLEEALTQTARTLPAVTARAERVLDQTHALLRRLDLLAKSAKAPVGKVGEAAASVSAVGADSRVLIRRLADQTVPELDATLRRLQRATDDIERLSQELEQHPQSVLFGKTPAVPGPGEPGFVSPRPQASP